ncbi:MAG: methyl-accepting chemotaxis protein [candidate division WOR-3 bacterium]|nr:methyl-accepting chemotaxis protein [candidate division WOR-3 bacterium]
MKYLSGFFRNLSITRLIIGFMVVPAIVVGVLALLMMNTFSDYSETTENILYMVEYQSEMDAVQSRYNRMISSFIDYFNTDSETNRIAFRRDSEAFTAQLNEMQDKYAQFPHETFSAHNDSLSVLFNRAITGRGGSEYIEGIEEMSARFNEDIVSKTNGVINMKINNLKNRLNNTLKIRLFVQIIVAGIVLVILIVLSIIIARIIRKDLKRLTDTMTRIGEDKDFTHSMDFETKFNELISINTKMNDLMVVIKDILYQLNENSSEIAAFSQELAASSQEVSSATEEVSASTENITSDIMVLKDYTDNMASSVEQMNNLMNQTVEFLGKAKNVNEDFMKLMNSETEMIDSSSENFVSMEKSIQNIKHFIDDFSGQVNTIQTSVDSIKKVHKKIELLSLNAAIEAARAGKEGGGFAVIAEEIRGLSSRSSNASKNIEGIMNEVIANIQHLHNLISKSLDGFSAIQSDWDKLSDISARVSRESENTYNETNNLTTGIEKIGDQFNELNKTFKEVKLRIDNVVASAEQISSSNEEITSQMEELTSSSQELSDKASRIKQFVSKFKI